MVDQSVRKLVESRATAATGNHVEFDPSGASHLDEILEELAKSATQSAFTFFLVASPLRIDSDLLHHRFPPISPDAQRSPKV